VTDIYSAENILLKEELAEFAATVVSQMKSFGSFRLDTANHCLWRDADRVSITPKAYDVLCHLVENSGRLVTPDEMLEAIWADTYVNPEVLRKYILEIRKALGDKRDDPQFVETVPKRGYRFIAPVCANSEPATSDAAEAITSSTTEVTVPQSEKVVALSGPARTRTLTWQWAAAIVPVIFVGALAFVWLSSAPLPPKVTATTQLTRDGVRKIGVLTDDGSRLYTTEAGNADRIVQASTNGGETSHIPTPFANPIVNAISPDHSQLLVLDSVGTEAESKFWSIPLPSGAPRRLGGLAGHSGTWSPDGRYVVFCTGSDIYQANADGTDPHKLATVSGEPNGLHFSPDGARIRFTIARPESASSALWEIRSDGSDLHPLFPGWHSPPVECCGVWTPDGRYYLFVSGIPGGDVWALREPTGLFRRRSSIPFQLTTGPLSLSSLTPSTDGRKLFVHGSQGRGELVRYDAKSHQFVPFLSGISAGELDFSQDGKWVTYVSYPENTLWRSRTDGSERLQLTYPPVTAGLPRWSPDGTQIAYVDTQLGRPWKAFLISAQGGSPKEVLPENHTQVDPSWSPDGKKLALGRTLATGETEPLLIQIVDLATRQASTIPGSETLYSPRWSPDGQYLAALSQDSTKLFLFNFKTQKWSDWITEPGIGFPNWSPDGHYLYYDIAFSDHPTFQRIQVGETRPEVLADLKALTRFASRAAGPWSSIAPDGSALFVRDLSTDEIYALDLELP
jgi:Tol biopolymer transport system component/DNA-binding winged helix-turn-helix (wHTH) protein